MFRLIVAILVFLMGDWIFFGGDLILWRMVGWVEAGAGLLADLIVRLIG
jgi:hypothetical protein